MLTREQQAQIISLFKKATNGRAKVEKIEFMGANKWVVFRVKYSEPCTLFSNDCNRIKTGLKEIFKRPCFVNKLNEFGYLNQGR